MDESFHNIKYSCTYLINTVCHGDEVNDLFDKYLIIVFCDSERKIVACIYYLLSSSGVACQLLKISGVVCQDIDDSKNN